MVRSITIIKITTRRIIVVTIIIRNINGVMVMVIWVVIRYIIIVGTSRSRVRIFTKAISVVIKVITWDMVMMICITIRLIILVRNSRITIRIYIKVVVIWIKKRNTIT